MIPRVENASRCDILAASTPTFGSSDPRTIVACILSAALRLASLLEFAFASSVGAVCYGRSMRLCWDRLRTLALAEVEATLDELPLVLRERARQLPVTFARRPSRALQADGFAADTLGMFVGPEFAEEGAVPMPPQIILFLVNLWEFAAADEEVFSDEVHTTYLHELGHYLGLDERELTERGLE
jgi:predicted Zn-dependent protease with MMP-like domain